MIHRRKPGSDYFTLPGKGIEPGESAGQACLRELQEETAIGDACLGGAEALRNSDTNSYDIGWLSVDELTEVDLRPRQILDHLLQLQPWCIDS